MPAKAVRRSKASEAKEQKSSRSDRRRPKGERGLTSSQALALRRDVFDDEQDVRHRRVLDEELSEESDGGVIEYDEEISSDDGEDDIGVSTSKKAKGKQGKAQKQSGASAKKIVGKQLAAGDDNDDDDGQSIGSSLDGAELADLSHMLSDDDDTEQMSFNARKANRNEAREANHAMLHSVGLKVSNKLEKDTDDDDGDDANDDHDGGLGEGGGSQRRRRRERTEARDESSALPQASAPLTVDALLNSLAKTEKYAKLAKEMGVAVGTKPSGKGLQGVSGIGGGSKHAHLALSAPLETVEKKRIERKAATAAAHADVSAWDSAVRQDEQAERLSFPENRPPKYGVSTGALASQAPEGEFELGIEKLLNEQGLSEAAVAQSEAEALSQMRSSLTEADVEKRVAELKKMRDLLFYHELKAKRVSKIKSKAYRKVHKKAGKMRAEQAETMGGLDKRTAQALALKREVERVQERMRLKHKNTSRWARHALKQQKNNPHIKQAVQEQIAKGEELRRKQMDANSREPKDSDEDSDSDDDDDDDDDDGEEGSGKTGLLWKLQSEPEPDMPEKGLFGMAFMRRAMERQKKEAQQMLEELKEMKDSRRDDDGSDGSEQDGDGGKEEEEELSADGDDDDYVYRDPSDLEAKEAKKRGKASKQGSDKAGASLGRRKVVPTVSKRRAATEESSTHSDEVPASGKERVAMRVKTPITLTAALPTASEVFEKAPTATTGESDGAAISNGDGGVKKGLKRARARLTESDKKAKHAAPAPAAAAAPVAAKANVIDEDGDWPAGLPGLDLELVPAASSAATKASKSSAVPAKSASIAKDFVPGELRATGLPEKPLIAVEEKSKGGQSTKEAGNGRAAPQGNKQRKKVQFLENNGAESAAQNGDRPAHAHSRDDEPTGFSGMFTDDSLVDGAALLQPTSTQQALLAEAFPESAKEFEADKAKLIESEAPPDESEPVLPGWGDWGGLGSRPSARAEAKKRSAQEARAELLAAAAKRRKDAALANVVICEKRDKKAVKFTTAGVPYPFASREQFEKSLRNPLGTEWNTRATHVDMVAPRISTVKGAVIQPIAEHRKGAPVDYKRKK